jgi:hypothetical protein
MYSKYSQTPATARSRRGDVVVPQITMLPEKSGGCISSWGKLPFDKLRANEKACPFALSREPVERSKGELAPKLKYTQPG